MYDALLAQRQRELGHVAKLVGGVVETHYHAGRGGDVFRPVPRDKQAKAVRFLVANAFSTPKELLLPDILFRIGPSGVADRVLHEQRNLLGSLLSERADQADGGPAGPRARRLLRRPVHGGGACDGGAGGIWSELAAQAPSWTCTGGTSSAPTWR